jgi:hypothetical protein
MENLFSRLTLDIIGKAVFDYDFDSLTHDDPVIQVMKYIPPPELPVGCVLAHDGPVIQALDHGCCQTTGRLRVWLTIRTF